MKNDKNWLVEYFKNKQLEVKNEKQWKENLPDKSVTVEHFNQNNGKKYLNHTENSSYHSPRAVINAKRFDDVFGDMYSKLNYTPEPLDYIDFDGEKKTYIYKSK